MGRSDTHTPKPVGRRLLDAAKALSPLVLCTALTCIALWPLPVRLGTLLLHGGRDKVIFLWDLWWVQFAITSLHQSPLSTTHLFAPQGVSLAFHTLALTDGLIGICCGSGGNLILAHNLVLLLSFVLTCHFTYLLIKEMTNSRAGALFGALLFTFGPARWFMVWNGHMNLSSTQWMPLFLLFSIRFFRTNSWRQPMFMALALAAVLYTGFQQTIFTFTLFLIMLPPLLMTHGASIRCDLKRTAGRGILFIALFLVLASPLILEMSRSAGSSILQVDEREWENMSVAPKRLLSGMTYYSRWDEIDPPETLSAAWSAVRGLLPTSGPIIGYTAVVLILLGWLSLCWRSWRAHRKRIIYWSAAVVLFSWMTFGPAPEILGIRIPSAVPILTALPGYDSIRGVIRYTLPLSLAAGILSGFIFSRFGELIRIRKNRAVGNALSARYAFALVAAVLMIALYVEFLKVPLHLKPRAKAPPVYYEGGIVHRTTDGSSMGGTLLELPYWYSGAGISSRSSHYETLYYQTIHHRKMLGGHVSRLSASMARESASNPVLAYFAENRLAGREPPTAGEVRQCFAEFDVRFVNISRRRYRPDDEKALRELFEGELDAELVHASNAFRTYLIDGVDRQPEFEADPS